VVNNELLEEYIRLYFGYGNLNAPIWFVGMEEGGEPDPFKFNEILKRWADGGKEHVVDIAPEETALNSRWFGSEKPPIQKTWGQLIRSTLVARDKEPSLNNIRAYQAKRLARPEDETCLLELMPLPAKNVKSWHYHELSNLSYLKSRKEYMDHIAPARELALAQLIETYRPKVVVFYSVKYFNRWQNIVGNGSNWSEQSFGETTNSKGTAFYCVPHPTAFGMKNSDYEALGEHMRAALR